MNTWLSRTLNNPKNSELPPLLHAPYTTTHITHSSSAPELTETRHCSIHTEEFHTRDQITSLYHKERNSIHIQKTNKLQMLKRLPFKIATWIYLNKSVATWWKRKKLAALTQMLRWCWQDTSFNNTQAQKFSDFLQQIWRSTHLLPQNLDGWKAYSLVYLHLTLDQFHKNRTSHGGHVRKVTDVCKNYQFCQHYYEFQFRFRSH